MLSFYLFNIFIEEAIIMLKEETKQIKINGIAVQCINAVVEYSEIFSRRNYRC